MGLQCGDEAQLVLGRGARENVCIQNCLRQICVAPCIEICTGQHRCGISQPDLLTDGRSGPGMVSGDHLDGNACGMTLLDCTNRLGAWRIDHADEADQGEFAVGPV